MKLKVAILEDNMLLLKDLKENLEATGLVDVVAWASTSDEFLNKVKQIKVEALLLDIDLGGDSMTGLDIASTLKLPVLFVSGKTRDFYTNIEDLNINLEITVEHISKPITIDKLKKILPKFITEINALNKAQYVFLDFGDTKRNKIAMDSIVWIESDTGKSGASNNKLIYFTNRKPEILTDFSFTKMEEIGFNLNLFITIHRSFRVNAAKIKCYHKITHEIEVEVFKSIDKTESKMLSVSENYRNMIYKFKK